MKKVLSLVTLIALVCGIGVAQSINGGDARTAALGGNPNNPYLQDYNDVYTNPAYALKYSDLLYVEVGNTFAGYTAKNQSIGFTMGNDNMAFGISVGHHEGPMYMENSYGMALGGVTAGADYMTIAGYEPQAPIQLYFATKLSGMSLGVTLYRAGFSRVNDGTGSDPYSGNGIGTNQKSDFSIGQTGLKAGILLDGNSDMIVDGSILFRINSASDDYTNSTAGANPTEDKISATGIELGAQGRMFLKMNEKTTLVPMLRFYTFGYQPEETISPSDTLLHNTKPNDYGRTDIEIGIGLNTKIKTSTVSVGLSFQHIGLKNDVTYISGTELKTTKTSMTMTDLPKVNIGAEIPLNGWLVGRVGYFRRFSTMTTTMEYPSPTPKTETSISSQPAYYPNLGYTAAQQELSFGLGLNYEGLSLNGYVAESFIADMPFIVSGKTQGAFGVLSMSYKF